MQGFSDAMFETMLGQVSQQRREKVLRFKFKEGQRQSLLAYIVLKELLGEHYGLEDNPVFRELENGKPVIIGHEDIHFNMSHCKNGVACVVGDQPVGIDVERIPAKLDESLCRYVHSDKEVEMVLNADKPCVEFIRLWTMKEAVVKLSGVGIKGKEQLRPLLNDVTPYNIITEVNEEKGYVVTVVTRK